MKLHIAAPVAGKGYAMVESSDGPLWWQAIDVPAQGLELTIPVDKTRNRHDLYLSTLVVRPGDKSRSATPKRAVGLLHLPLGMKIAASIWRWKARLKCARISRSPSG